MKNRLITIGISAIVCITAPAFGETQNDNAAAKTEKKVCKTFLDTGSRLNKTKICKTAAEWAEDQSENAKLLREKRGNQGAPQIGNGG